MYSISYTMNLYDVPEFLTNKEDSGLQAFSNYYDESNKMIYVHNNILKNDYTFSCQESSMNYLFYKIVSDSHPVIKRYKILQETVYLVRTKDNKYLCGIIFDIDQKLYKKNLYLAVYNSYQTIIISISHIKDEDFLIILDQLNITKYEKEILNLYHFVKMNEVEYIHSKRKYFSTYNKVDSFNGIDIYHAFNIFPSASYLDQIGYIFIKRGKMYIPKTIFEYAYLYNKVCKPKGYKIIFETYQYREIKVDRSSYIQVKHCDEWVTIPSVIPNNYYKEFEALKDIVYSRKKLLEKIGGKT